ncbi:sensor histidine kinase [Streptosporangium sp. NPDC003464]
MRLDLWERRLARLTDAAPYALLAISTALAWLTDGRSGADRLGTPAIALLAGAWILWMVTLRPGRQARPFLMGIYCAGLLVLIAVLVSRSFWFIPFFGFTGYLHSWRFLPGSWRLAGVTGTAAITVTAVYGGPPATLSAALFHLLFVGAIVGMVALFSLVGEVTAEQSAQRKEMIAELAEANSRLEATMRENTGLHAQLLVQAREAGVLDERQRVAREIHDTIAQGLAGIITQVQAARQAGQCPAEQERHLDNAVRLARESLTEARRTVHAVGPQVLETARLPDALADVARRWSHISGVAVEVATTGTARPLHPEVEVTLLRAAQEALANVAGHAHASRVGLTLSYMGEVITLDVRDDGVGFRPGPAGAGGGFGLAAMRQRVSRLAGTLEIESEPGQGTAVSASLPAISLEARDG